MENSIDNGRNRHGFPRGYHFVPHDLELMHLLDEQLAGRPLPRPLPNIFHHVRIRDFHPADLYEDYREHEEAGYIYFFDHREYRTAGQRPARATAFGGWKASGGGKGVWRDGFVVGYKLTMVFYEREHPGMTDRKTEWALNEYTRLVGPDKEVESLALYRLYKKRPGRGAGPAPVEEEAQPSPYPTAGGMSTAANKASVAALTSPPQARAGQPHYHDHQHAHGAATALGPSNWFTPADAAEGYLADEFKVWCETKPEAASPSRLPMPYDDLLLSDLPMLMDERELYSCTVEELLAQMLKPDANLDDTAAPAATSTPTPDANHQV